MTNEQFLEVAKPFLRLAKRISKAPDTGIFHFNFNKDTNDWDVVTFGDIKQLAKALETKIQEGESHASVSRSRKADHAGR